MDIRRAVTVDAPIASGNDVIVRDAIGDTLAVAAAIIDGKLPFRSRNTPPTVQAASFS